MGGGPSQSPKLSPSEAYETEYAQVSEALNKNQFGKALLAEFDKDVAMGITSENKHNVFRYFTRPEPIQAGIAVLKEVNLQGGKDAVLKAITEIENSHQMVQDLAKAYCYSRMDHSTGPRSNPHTGPYYEKYTNIRLNGYSTVLVNRYLLAAFVTESAETSSSPSPSDISRDVSSQVANVGGSVSPVKSADVPVSL